MNKQSHGFASVSAVGCCAPACLIGRSGSAWALALLVGWTGVATARPPEGASKRKYVSIKDNGVAAEDPVARPTDPQSARNAKRVEPLKPEDVKGPHPIIKPDEEAHNFGASWVGPPLQHTFKITNAGDAPLEITRVKPSCGCTIAGNYPKTLAPGESGDFPFSMASTKLRGHFEKSVTISSNDPVTPDLRLKLKGEVKRYVEVTPPSANFARITSQETYERIVNITNNTDTPLQLSIEQPEGSKFKTELEEKTPGKQFDLRISAIPPFEPGNLRTTITLKTNIPEQKDVTVDVNGIVPARLEVQPSLILVQPPRGEESTGVSRVVRFTNYGKSKVKLLEATVDDPGVTVNVSERKAGESYVVQIQMPPGYQPSSPDTKITLKTDDREQPILTVPIQSTVSARTQKVADTEVIKKVAPKAVPSAAPTVVPVVANAAPSFKVSTIDGKEVSNESLKGKVAVLDFFAPNCGFCKKQIPRIEPIRAQYADKGVRFINVSQKMGTKEYTQDEVIDMMKQLGFRGELAINHTNEVGRAFQASGFPTMVILDKDGKVAVTNVGNIGDLEDRMKKQLDALLAGKPIPTEVAAAPSTPTPPTPPAPSAGAGQTAPEIDLKTVDGKDVTNSTFAQAPATVLDFFAVNCGYCVKQIPRLETVRKTYAEKGVRFVNIQETMRKEYSEEEAKKKMSDLGWGGELARDPGNEYGPKFGARGFPTMVIVGKSGKIEAVNVGNIGDLETKVAAQLDALIAGRPIPAEVAAAPNAPKPAPAQPSAGVGQPAPEITLKTVDGKDLTNSTFAQAPATVLDFFAVNCGFCVKQIPRLETVRKTYAEKGIRFVTVQETMRKEYSEEEAKKKLAELGWSGELARDPNNDFGPRFGARGFPTMVIVGKNGKIEAVNIGNIPDLESKVAAQLDAILAGKPASTVDAGAPADDTPAPSKTASKKPRRPAEELVGSQAPSFILKTVEGKTVSSDDFGKHPATVLNFVAPNCGFCKRQIPNVDKVRADYESKGIRFVNVYQRMGKKDFEPDEAIEVFKKEGSNLELARDTGNEVGQLYKATSYPTMVVINKSGKIEHVNVGAKPNIEKIVRDQLDGLLGGGK